ncbi:hypothetical protein E1A91_A10G204100v1 [Gossypium mustelinum]|uniref:Uncharacterized protein n=1 Tax=Gossypium mustelinum TaxID=34275 RepID=A0A5D2XPD6_GOSMU|nr:hypothetical protein E1A91_A10G204100v1 [Gossypium mustelinum]
MGLQKPLRRHLSQRIWFTEAFLAYACPLSYLLPGLSFVGDCIVLITRSVLLIESVAFGPLV